MRIVFMGTAELAGPCLETLAGLPGHTVVGVVTQPDRPKGRALRPAPPPVKVVAERLGLPVDQPQRIKEPAAIDRLRALAPELIVVVAYGQILPASVLALPTRGCINVHASLLPRWRGAAPIQYAIWHGDRETGVTTMYLNEAMDEGDIILQRAEPIHSDDTGGVLHDRLARIGAVLLQETVEAIAAGTAPRRPQDSSHATYARKLTKEDGHIQWRKPAVEIERQIRAFDPWPGSFTFWKGNLLKIWKAEVAAGLTGPPGQIVAPGTVATGRDSLKLLEVQPAGGKRLPINDFLHGHDLPPGEILA